MSDVADTPKDSFDVDVSRVNPDSFEQQMAAGKLLPEGYYYAFLNGAVRGQTKGSEEKKIAPRDKWTLTFKIEGGIYDGREVEDDILAPNDNQFLRNRLLLFKHRLGIIRRTEDGKSFEKVPNKTDFQDCLDTKVIIHVKHEEFPKDDGTKGINVRLDFNGLHRVDDAKALDKVGKPVESKPTTPSGATTKSEPPKKQFNTADL